MDVPFAPVIKEWTTRSFRRNFRTGPSNQSASSSRTKPLRRCCFGIAAKMATGTWGKSNTKKPFLHCTGRIGGRLVWAVECSRKRGIPDLNRLHLVRTTSFEAKLRTVGNFLENALIQNAHAQQDTFGRQPIEDRTFYLRRGTCKNHQKSIKPSIWKNAQDTKIQFVKPCLGPQVIHKK